MWFWNITGWIIGICCIWWLGKRVIGVLLGIPVAVLGSALILIGYGIGETISWCRRAVAEPKSTA